ncbi:nucleotide exchange factor GrpE [Nocardia sp. NPDC127579]|uniref:nucleotide exchange factor GrpE n=1 Tax=Nocardia sp. NPDC127579 TaxID=3345402 RepID=UPI003631DFA8
MTSDAIEQSAEPHAVADAAPETDLVHALCELTAQVRREHDRARAREVVIDRLHQENQALRRDQIDSMLVPVRNGLFRLHDALCREVGRWAPGTPPPVEAVRDLFDAFADDVRELIERTGVQPYDVAPGQRFDPVRHRVGRRMDVDDPESDACVLEVTAVGFERGDRVVRPAQVVVGRFVADREQ